MLSIRILLVVSDRNLTGSGSCKTRGSCAQGRLRSQPLGGAWGTELGLWGRSESRGFPEVLSECHSHSLFHLLTGFYYVVEQSWPQF